MDWIKIDPTCAWGLIEHSYTSKAPFHQPRFLRNPTFWFSSIIQFSISSQKVLKGGLLFLRLDNIYYRLRPEFIFATGDIDPYLCLLGRCQNSNTALKFSSQVFLQKYNILVFFNISALELSGFAGCWKCWNSRWYILYTSINIIDCAPILLPLLVI